MLRLYHSPLACSLASRLALLESGLEHEVSIVRTWKNEQKTDAYRAINPRGTVPSLQADQGVLTESTAILPYIADLVPEKNLMPPPYAFARAKAQAWLSFFSSTLHASLSAAMFLGASADNDVAKEAALARVIAAFHDIDGYLAGRDHVLGSFSVCDLYLAVFSMWRVAPALAGRLPDFANIDRLQQSVFARPGVMSIIDEEKRLRAD